MSIPTKWNELALYRIERNFKDLNKTQVSFKELDTFCNKACEEASKINKNERYFAIMDYEYFQDLQDYLYKVGSFNNETFELDATKFKAQQHWVSRQVMSMDYELVKGCASANKILNTKMAEQESRFNKKKSISKSF